MEPQQPPPIVEAAAAEAEAEAAGPAAADDNGDPVGGDGDCETGASQRQSSSSSSTSSAKRSRWSDIPSYGGGECDCMEYYLHGECDCDYDMNFVRRRRKVRRTIDGKIVFEQRDHRFVDKFDHNEYCTCMTPITSPHYGDYCPTHAPAEALRRANDYRSPRLLLLLGTQDSDDSSRKYKTISSFKVDIGNGSDYHKRKEMVPHVPMGIQCDQMLDSLYELGKQEIAEMHEDEDEDEDEGEDEGGSSGSHANNDLQQPEPLRWVCDVCEDVSYEDYDECVRHEDLCRQKQQQQHQMEEEQEQEKQQNLQQELEQKLQPEQEQEQEQNCVPQSQRRHKKQRWFNDNSKLMMTSLEIPDDYLSMCSRRLQNDPAFVCFIIRRRIEHFRMDICKAVDVLDHCHPKVFDDFRFYEYFNSEFEKELDAHIVTGSRRYNLYLNRITKKVGPTLRNDSEFVLKYVKEWAGGTECLYQRVSDRLKDDGEFILSSINNKIDVYRSTSWRVAKTATVGALPYASHRLRSDPSFMMRAEEKFLKQEVPSTVPGHCVLCHASPVLFDDEKFMKEMHKKINSVGSRPSCCVLRFASDRLRNRADFVLQVCPPRSNECLHFISRELFLDKAFILSFLEKTSNPRILKEAGYSIRNDEDVIRTAMRVWSDDLMDRRAAGENLSLSRRPLRWGLLPYCSRRLIACRDIVKNSIALSPYSIHFAIEASEILRNDEDLALFALTSVRTSVFVDNQDVYKHTRRVFYMLSHLTSRAQFVVEAVKVCPYLFRDVNFLKRTGNYLQAAVIALGCSSDRKPDFWMERYGPSDFFGKLRSFWMRSGCFHGFHEDIRRLDEDLREITGSDSTSLRPVLDDRTAGWRSRYEAFSTGQLNAAEWKFRQWEKLWLTDILCSSVICRSRRNAEDVGDGTKTTTSASSSARATTNTKYPSEVLRRIVEFTGTDRLLKNVSRIKYLEPLINKVLERNLMVPKEGVPCRAFGEQDWRESFSDTSDHSDNDDSDDNDDDDDDHHGNDGSDNYDDDDDDDNMSLYSWSSVGEKGRVRGGYDAEFAIDSDNSDHDSFESDLNIEDGSNDPDDFEGEGEDTVDRWIERLQEQMEDEDEEEDDESEDDDGRDVDTDYDLEQMEEEEENEEEDYLSDETSGDY